MVRLSNGLIGVLSIISFLLSSPILIAGVWLSWQVPAECERFLEKPVIAVGGFLIIVSIAGIIGSCCRISWLLWVYILLMSILILLLVCFTIFAFVVTIKRDGTEASGGDSKEYRLGNYSNWLQKRVSNDKKWNRIKSCLQDRKICKTLIDAGKDTTLDDFRNMTLTAIESGCCKPADECNFIYVNPTSWTKIESSNLDCNSWGNDPNVMCYDCLSCKAEMLEDITNNWRKVAIVNTIFIGFLTVLYFIGCCAFRNNREDNLGKQNS